MTAASSLSKSDTAVTCRSRSEDPFRPIPWAMVYVNILVGPKVLTVAAEGCRSPQELKKAGRRAAIFLVSLIDVAELFLTGA